MHSVSSWLPTLGPWILSEDRFCAYLPQSLASAQTSQARFLTHRLSDRYPAKSLQGQGNLNGSSWILLYELYVDDLSIQETH